MKYTGDHADTFEREAYLMVEHFADKPADYRDDHNLSFEDRARELARDYGVADTDIWDYLAEYDTEE